MSASCCAYLGRFACGQGLRACGLENWTLQGHGQVVKLAHRASQTRHKGDWVRTSDIVRQLWCEFYSRHCEGWVSWFGASRICVLRSRIAKVSRGKDKAVFDRRGCDDRGVFVQCWRVCGRGMVAVSGPRWDAVEEREKIWSFGVREAGVCQATEASVVLPEVLGLFIDEEQMLAEKLRTVSGFKESNTIVKFLRCCWW